MIPVRIESLMLGFPPSPSVLTLCPLDPKGKFCDAILPIWIGSSEATAIAAALEHNKQPRPLTHSLMKNIISSLHGELAQVVIDSVDGTIFHASLIIRQSLTTCVQVDARPSDAIALALRCDTPIFVEDKVMEAASTPRSLAPGADKKIELEEFHKFVQNVTPDDFSIK